MLGAIEGPFKKYIFNPQLDLAVFSTANNLIAIIDIELETSVLHGTDRIMRYL